MEGLLAFPPDPLATAEINYAHEADELIARAQQRRLENAASGEPVDFAHYPGHKCSSASCSLVTAPADELVYACPMPEEHPLHMRSNGEPVLHRWSRDVSVCYSFATVHVCTAQMCSHQLTEQGNTVCRLTGRSFGGEIAAVYESGYFFESGKAMTATRLDAADADAINTTLAKFSEARPENRDNARHRNSAAEQAAAAPSTLKRTIDLSGLSRQVDGSRTAGPLGLLTREEVEQRKRLAITASAPPATLSGLLEPMITPSQPGDRPRPVSSTGRPVSAVGEGPRTADIRLCFERLVAQLWDQLERSYSLRERRRELYEAEARVVSQLIDKRSFQTGGARRTTRTIAFDAVAALNDRETQRAFEGMVYVRIMAQWEPWTSGRIRREVEPQLVCRMWKLWEQIARSPAYYARPEPHLYARVAAAMLEMVIDGYQFAACQRGTGARRRWSQRCQHRIDAVSQGACGCKQLFVTLVAPGVVMRQLLSPEGMRQRVLAPVLGHTLGNRNTVQSFLSSLFVAPGLDAAQLREVCVRE